MTQDEIRAIALEVAKEMGFRCVEDYILFATRFLAAINAKAEPVAEVHGDPDYVHTWQVYPIKRGSYKPGDKLFLHPAIEPALSAARSLTDELMDCVDRLGSEYDTVDPRVWEHMLVYANPVGAAPLPDDVAQMVEALRRHEWVPVIQQAADLIERLARQVPPDCVVVPREPFNEALDILKRVRDGELGNCLAYRKLTEVAIL